ncbi:hypothetical protein [Psychrobacillus sp.]|uniref:hypothetical protein n=1 Tax=Psychrobacillus sp. TaxID=1871623 RepID=UPI0028BF1EAB|nr:hypothetical protein [Psychrobacillus sp.]
MLDDFQRVVRFRDLEVWDIQLEKSIYRMIIFDENRPATINDFPSPHPNIKEEIRANLITVSVYSNHPVQAGHIKLLDRFAKQLTNHLALAHCHVFVTFFTEDIESTLTRVIKEKIKLVYEELPIEKLASFSQEYKNK